MWSEAPEMDSDKKLSRKEKRKLHRQRGEKFLPLMPGDDSRSERSDLVKGAVESPSLRSSNAIRSRALLFMFLAIVALNTTLFGVATWYFSSRTKAEFQAKIDALQEHPPEAMDATRAEGLARDANEKTQQKFTTLEETVASLKHDLSETQKKIEGSSEQFAQINRRLADLAAQIHESRPGTATAPVKPGAAQESLPPPPSELVLLKERNRLTSYADEAIATGLRGPYERLWDALDDPRLANLVHAARAEIFRVQDCFLNGQRAKFYGIQQHRIPVADIFPDSGALTETQLSDEQMIQIVLDQKQPWQTRVKAAWHLGHRRSTKVGDALVKVIKEDPQLDVIAEATFSFEQMTGYRAKLFEIKPLEAWWASYNISQDEAAKKAPPKNPTPAAVPARKNP